MCIRDSNRTNQTRKATRLRIPKGSARLIFLFCSLVIEAFKSPTFIYADFSLPDPMAAWPMLENLPRWATQVSSLNSGSSAGRPAMSLLMAAAPDSRGILSGFCWCPRSCARCYGATGGVCSSGLHGEHTRKPGRPSKFLRFAVNRA